MYPRCKFNNPASARFCAQCSTALGKVAVELEEARECADNIVAKVMLEFLRRTLELVKDILKQTGIANEIAGFYQASLARVEGGGISK